MIVYCVVDEANGLALYLGMRNVRFAHSFWFRVVQAVFVR